jgi:hypothetical protein
VHHEHQKFLHVRSKSLWLAFANSACASWIRTKEGQYIDHLYYDSLNGPIGFIYGGSVYSPWCMYMYNKPISNGLKARSFFHSNSVL